MERVRNIIKTDTKKNKRSLSEEDIDVQPKKRMRIKGTQLLRRYPVTTDAPGAESDETFKQHMKGISSEMKKAKPRDGVLLPLMRSTYGQRRLFILNDADSVRAIVDSHPALVRQAVVNI